MNMKTQLLYLDDSYMKECDAVVLKSGEDGIVLDRTVFYPEGGGQPSDTGIILHNGNMFRVDSVQKRDEVYHHIAGQASINDGDSVKLTIDWEKRYMHMRYHTSLHIISGVVNNLYKVKITGNQIYADKARIDFNLNDSAESVIEDILSEANKIVKNDVKINIKYIRKEELRDDMIRVKKELLPDLEIYRMIEIEGVDMQPDGGTHVKSSSEVGMISMMKRENKGKNNKRIYITLSKLV
ncbi:MAG: alanyl-tRNA editing protein [Thermoplasmata archaeon]